MREEEAGSRLGPWHFSRRPTDAGVRRSWQSGTWTLSPALPIKLLCNLFWRLFGEFKSQGLDFGSWQRIWDKSELLTIVGSTSIVGVLDVPSGAPLALDVNSMGKVKSKNMSVFLAVAERTAEWESGIGASRPASVRIRWVALGSLHPFSDLQFHNS